MSSDIHSRTISQEISQPSITKICLRITCLKFHSNFPGANELRLNHVTNRGSRRITFAPIIYCCIIGAITTLLRNHDEIEIMCFTQLSLRLLSHLLVDISSITNPFTTWLSTYICMNKLWDIVILHATISIALWVNLHSRYIHVPKKTMRANLYSVRQSPTKYVSIHCWPRMRNCLCFGRKVKVSQGS